MRPSVQPATTHPGLTAVILLVFVTVTNMVSTCSHRASTELRLESHEARLDMMSEHAESCRGPGGLLWPSVWESQSW